MGAEVTPNAEAVMIASPVSLAASTPLGRKAATESLLLVHTKGTDTLVPDLSRAVAVSVTRAPRSMLNEVVSIRMEVIWTGGVVVTLSALHAASSNTTTILRTSSALSRN